MRTRTIRNRALAWLLLYWLVWNPGVVIAQTGSGTTGSGAGNTTPTGSGDANGSGILAAPELGVQGMTVPLCIVAGALLILSESRRKSQ